MKSLPSHCRSYKHTPVFNQDTVPAGLLKSHHTKAGTWGKIVVLEGKLTYRILAPQFEEYTLDPNNFGVVDPEVPHEVRPLGQVRFFVDFHR